jgi:hypothetical protein
MKKKVEELYIAYFDNLGFEVLQSLSRYEKLRCWQELKNGSSPEFPVYSLIMRAKANPQRNPEVYYFWSAVGEERLIELCEESPQQFADYLRKNGNPIFVTDSPKEIIK